MRKIIKIKQSDLLNLVESKLYKIIGQDGKVKATELNHNLAMKVNDSFDGQIIPIDEDLVSGGKADNMSLEDIAKKHKVSVEHLEKQLKIGIEIEKEHVGNKIDMAIEIAKDHLVEDPNYYTSEKPKNWGEKELEKEKVENMDIVNKKLVSKGKPELIMAVESELNINELYEAEYILMESNFFEFINQSEIIQEAEYKGKAVQLGKPMRGDVKKYKVYVKNDKGNVVKVNFGDPNMEIKRDNPERRKAFRDRHNCKDKKDRASAGYWSCKLWSNKSVSDILKGN